MSMNEYKHENSMLSILFLVLAVSWHFLVSIVYLLLQVLFPSVASVLFAVKWLGVFMLTLVLLPVLYGIFRGLGRVYQWSLNLINVS